MSDTWDFSNVPFTVLFQWFTIQILRYKYHITCKKHYWIISIYIRYNQPSVGTSVVILNDISYASHVW